MLQIWAEGIPTRRHFRPIGEAVVEAADRADIAGGQITPDRKSAIYQSVINQGVRKKNESCQSSLILLYGTQGSGDEGVGFLDGQPGLTTR
jgi:hypothetical protein